MTDGTTPVLYWIKEKDAKMFFNKNYTKKIAIPRADFKT